MYAGLLDKNAFFSVVIGKDCWELAKEALEEFVAGTWDPPGEKMAEKLNEQYLKVFIQNQQRRN